MRVSSAVALATEPSPGDPIPAIVHFIFGLSDDPAQRVFTFAHYAAVHAAHELLQPAALWLHYAHLPSGAWWERSRPLLQLHTTHAHGDIFSRPLAHAAHRSDVLRLQLLITHGGIYLDLDVVVVRPFAPLLRAGHDFVMGKEGDVDAGGFHGLCNAVMLARPNASFALRWLERYRDFGSGHGDAWSYHSVQLPALLAESHPTEVHVLPHTAFFWPDWHEDTVRTLLLERSDPLSHGAYAFHLWSSASQRMLLSAWSPSYLASVPSSLNCLLTRSLPRLAADAAPLPGGIARNCSCGQGGDGGEGGEGGDGRGGSAEIRPEGAWLLQPAWGAAGGGGGGGGGGRGRGRGRGRGGAAGGARGGGGRGGDAKAPTKAPTKASAAA